MTAPPPSAPCALCTRLMRSDDNLCDRCAVALAATVRMLPVRTPPPADDLTAYVERWMPPVPTPRRRP